MHLSSLPERKGRTGLHPNLLGGHGKIARTGTVHDTPEIPAGEAVSSEKSLYISHRIRAALLHVIERLRTEHTNIFARRLFCRYRYVIFRVRQAEMARSSACARLVHVSDRRRTMRLGRALACWRKCVIIRTDIKLREQKELAQGRSLRLERVVSVTHITTRGRISRDLS